MSATATQVLGDGSVLRPLIDQIAGVQRPKDNHAGGHGEGQHEHDEAHTCAPVRIVSGLQDACCAGGDNKGQRERQGFIRRSEIVEHRSRLPR